MTVAREEIAGILGESKRALDAEHGALRAEVESGIRALGGARPAEGG